MWLILKNSIKIPGGVAANNIGGETIESALPVMSRNRSGVVVQAPDLKANTNFKLEKLKFIGLDEVR